MEEAKFAIIDVETTGGGIKDNKITEICIIVLQNGEEVNRFVSLINPQRDIPYYIEKLTGINDAMVADAPRFEEVASAINEVTRDCIFVAHNVGFDYNVVRSEFESAGIDFNRKRLCTVRLSKKLIPGLFSYSLGNLCTSINIPHRDRHRAQGENLKNPICRLILNLQILKIYLQLQVCISSKIKRALRCILAKLSTFRKEYYRILERKAIVNMHCYKIPIL